MRASSRAIVVAAIVAVALALNGQESCPPPAPPVLHWVGQGTGCTAENGFGCAPFETIVFSVTPSGGGSYPGCVTYLWDFGNGFTSTAAAPSHVYVAAGVFFVVVRVRGGGVEELDGKQMVITLSVVPRIEHFGASATVVRRGQTVILTWSTRNATSLLIDPIGVNLDATVTSYSFVPTVTRTYTLTAFGDAAFRVSTPVTVVVSEPRQRAVRH